ASSGSSSYASVKEMDHESSVSSIRMRRESDESSFNTVIQTCERLENSAARDKISVKNTRRKPTRPRLSTLGERDENEQDLFSTSDDDDQPPPLPPKQRTYLKATQSLPVDQKKSLLSSTPEEVNINDETQRHHLLSSSSREHLSKQQNYLDSNGKSSSIIDKQRNEDISSTTLKTPTIPLVSLTDIDTVRAKLRLSSRRDRSADNVLLLSSSSTATSTNLRDSETTSVSPQSSSIIQRSVSFKRPITDTDKSAISKPSSTLSQLTMTQSLYHQTSKQDEQFTTIKSICSSDSRSDKTEDENTHNHFRKSNRTDLTSTSDNNLETLISSQQPVLKSKQDYADSNFNEELINNTQIDENKLSSRFYDNNRYRNEQQIQKQLIEPSLAKATFVTTTFPSSALSSLVSKHHLSTSNEHIYDNLDVFRHNSKDLIKYPQEDTENIAPSPVSNDTSTSSSSVQTRDHGPASVRQKRPTTVHVSSDKQKNELENVWNKLQKQRSIKRIKTKQEEITKDDDQVEMVDQTNINELESKYERHRTPSPEQQVPKEESTILELSLPPKLTIEKKRSPIEQPINNRRKTVGGIQAKVDILNASTITKNSDGATTNSPSWIDIAKQKQVKYNTTKDTTLDVPLQQQSTPIDKDYKKVNKTEHIVSEINLNVTAPVSITPSSPNSSPLLSTNNTKTNTTTFTSSSPRSSSQNRRLSTKIDSKDENNKPSSTLITTPTTITQVDYRSNRKSMYVGEPTPAMSTHERDSIRALKQGNPNRINNLIQFFDK
ncbi:unnamed protein product, partial [Didymodactylos carnosus]